MDTTVDYIFWELMDYDETIFAFFFFFNGTDCVGSVETTVWWGRFYPLSWLIANIELVLLLAVATVLFRCICFCFLDSVQFRHEGEYEPRKAQRR